MTGKVQQTSRLKDPAQVVDDDLTAVVKKIGAGLISCSKCDLKSLMSRIFPTHDIVRLSLPCGFSYNLKGPKDMWDCAVRLDQNRGFCRSVQQTELDFLNRMLRLVSSLICILEDAAHIYNRTWTKDMKNPEYINFRRIRFINKLVEALSPDSCAFYTIFAFTKEIPAAMLKRSERDQDNVANAAKGKIDRFLKQITDDFVVINLLFFIRSPICREKLIELGLWEYSEMTVESPTLTLGEIRNVSKNTTSTQSVVLPTSQQIPEGPGTNTPKSHDSNSNGISMSKVSTLTTNDTISKDLGDVVDCGCVPTALSTSSIAVNGHPPSQPELVPLTQQQQQQRQQRQQHGQKRTEEVFAEFMPNSCWGTSPMNTICGSTALTSIEGAPNCTSEDTFESRVSSCQVHKFQGLTLTTKDMYQEMNISRPIELNFANPHAQPLDPSFCWGEFDIDESLQRKLLPFIEARHGYDPVKALKYDNNESIHVYWLKDHKDLPIIELTLENMRSWGTFRPKKDPKSYFQLVYLQANSYEQPQKLYQVILPLMERDCNVVLDRRGKNTWSMDTFLHQKRATVLGPGITLSSGNPIKFISIGIKFLSEAGQIESSC